MKHAFPSPAGYRRHFEENAARSDDAGTADYASAGSFRLRKDLVEEWLPDRGGGVLADIGCGNGLLSASVAGWRNSIGLDFARGMLLAARRRGLIVVQSGAEAIPLRTGSADAALAVEIAQYLPDVEPLVAELIRITRPGGIVILSCLLSSWARRLRSTLQPQGPHNPHLHSMSRTRAAIERHGAHVAETLIWLQPTRIRLRSRVGLGLGEIVGTAFAVKAVVGAHR